MAHGARVALRSRRGTRLPTNGTLGSTANSARPPCAKLDALADTLVDDASAGQYTNALPILQRLSMPATFTRTIVAAHGPVGAQRRQSDLGERQAAREAGMAPNVAGQPGQPRRA